MHGKIYISDFAPIAIGGTISDLPADTFVRTWNLEPGTWNLESGIWNPEFVLLITD